MGDFLDFDFIQTIIVGIVGVIALFTFRILAKGNVINIIKAKEEIAKIAWQATIDIAELYGWDIERAKQEAAKRLHRLAKEHGLKITEEQVFDLIASAYETWLETWEEEWDDSSDEEDNLENLIEE